MWWINGCEAKMIEIADQDEGQKFTLVFLPCNRLAKALACKSLKAYVIYAYVNMKRTKTLYIITC